MNDEIFAKTFWNNLEIELKKQKGTIAGICFVTGLSEGSLRASKCRNRTPSLQDAYTIANELGVSLEYLITGVEPSEKIPDDLQSVINKYSTKD